MPGLDANIARYYFESPALPPEVFQVARFKGVEEVSRLYRYELELVSTDPSVEFSSVVGQPATFTLMRGDEEELVFGMVVDFRQEGRSKDYFAYRAVLAPGLWQLSLTHQSRVFQHLTVEEIITQVLSEAPFAPLLFEFNLSGSHPVLDYVVQFQETDLNFICRLMEKYGIYFFFKHDYDNGREKLIITDDKQVLESISGESVLDYHEFEGMVPPDVEVVNEFTCREQLVTGKVVLKDYNYETPDAELKVESQLNGDMEGTHYEYGNHYKDDGEGAWLAQIRNEEIESRRRVFEGASNCVGFRGGFIYELANHYRADFEEQYLITWVHHHGSQRHALGLDALPGEGHQGEETYSNTFRCLPMSQPFRPERRTPVPQVPGVMIAKTEHPDRNADDYGHIDDQGRYRAKMNFDLADTPPADATKPIRMKQTYSGPGYGVHFPNHDATEMIWACVNGDVDRPMALGTVPNPNQGSPSTVGNKWQSVIRTWGRNELTFDDKVGEENIYMFATKDHTVVVTNDESFSVGHDQTTTVQNDQTNTIHHDQTNTVKNNKTTTVDGTHTETIKLDTTICITEGPYSHDVADNTATYHVKGAVTETYEDRQETTVNKEIVITSETQHIHVTAETEIKLEVGDSKILMKKDGTIEISGKNITINGSESVNIHGGSVTSKADQDHNTEGQIVMSNGTATNTVKGGMVMLNPA